MPEHADRPPIAQAPLSVILLADGPPSDVAEGLSRWTAYLATLDRPFELLLLGGTPIDAEANPSFAGARVIASDPAAGYGPALHAAVQAAQHPLVVFCPADRQFAPADLQHLLGTIDHVDLALGCRRVARRPLVWRLLGRALALVGRVLAGLSAEANPCTPGATPWRRRWVARWAFGVRLIDPESPFRLGRRDALARIVLQSHGRFALVEQLAKANHLELILAEEPVPWSPPATPATAPDHFAADARAVFRHPDFGPPALHVGATAPPVPAAPAAAKPADDPTKAAPPSS